MVASANTDGAQVGGVTGLFSTRSHPNTLFWGLTVEVNKKEIRLYFGLGLIGRTICRQRIAQVAQVRNRWWYGWGIRLTPHGWMWSMGGLNAVELTYQNNKSFRIGTDQPQALLKASADN